MQQDWIEDLLAVLDAGSLTAAAEQRFLTQSAFTRRMRAMEEALGTQLLDRTTKFQPKLFARLAIIVPVLLIFILGIVYAKVPFDYAKNAWFLTSYTEGVGY